MTIPGIVLAGGKSSRMGRPKALLPIGSAGDTFFDRVTRTLLAAGIDEIVVVVGADAEAIRSVARPMAGVRIVTNPDYEHGQLSSLLTGLRAIDAASVSAALITLIDVPLVTEATVRMLIAVQRERGAPLVRPVSNGRHGHPVIFGRALVRRASMRGSVSGREAGRSSARGRDDRGADRRRGRFHRHRHTRRLRAVHWAAAGVILIFVVAVGQAGTSAIALHSTHTKSCHRSR